MYHVYIMANARPTLYIGVTNDLLRRVFEHREGPMAGFTKKYFLKRLVYFEPFTEVEQAIRREKALKHYPRQKKLQLIREANPDFRDLYPDLVS